MLAKIERQLDSGKGTTSSIGLPKSSIAGNGRVELKDQSPLINTPFNRHHNPFKQAGHHQCYPTPPDGPRLSLQVGFNPAKSGQTPWGAQLATGTDWRYHYLTKRKHQRTLKLIFARPVSGGLPWRDVEAHLVELGAEVSERAGSRVAVVLFGEVRVFHRPHPSPDTDKGAVASIRKWFEEHGVTP